MAFHDRHYGVDARMLRRAHALIGRALEGGRHLTRKELSAVLARGGIQAEKERMVGVMMNAELDCLVCSGPLMGKQHTYALLEERVPKAPGLTRDEALAELARRFFAGHAPATLRHFAWWSDLTLKDARRALAMIRPELSGHVVDGTTDWFGVARPPARSRTPRVYLLPEYDECLTGWRDLGTEDMARATRTWRDTFLKPIVVDGRRAGTWRRTMQKDAVLLEINLFARLSAAETRALKATVRRFGDFLGSEVVLRSLS